MFPETESLNLTETPSESDVILTDTDSPVFRDFARFSELIDSRFEANRTLKTVEAEMARLQPRLLDYFERHAIDKVRVKGVTIFLRTELWARPKFAGDRARVCAALKEAGLGHYVEPNYNAHELSAWVRELKRANEDRLLRGEVPDIASLLPPVLAAVLSVEPTYKIQGRRSA